MHIAAISEQQKQKMRQNPQLLSQTQRLINYHTIQERVSQDTYTARRSLYSPQKDRNMVPMHKFQQYFGKMKPSIFQQLKSIFAHVNIAQRGLASSSEQPFCHVQGAMLSSRVQSIRKRKEADKKDNNFRVEGIKDHQMARKAKMNTLFQLRFNLEDHPIKDQDARSILKESGELVEQLKQTIKKGRKNSVTPSHKTFRLKRSLEKSIQREPLVSYLNPQGRQIFTVGDFHRALTYFHGIRIKVPSNISYFSVYVEDGNNSQLLKMLIRKRTGWRVVQIPAIANLIWTQLYKRSALKKRLNKREKQQTDTEEEKFTIRNNGAFRSGRASSLNKSLQTQCSTPLRQAQTSFSTEIRKLVPHSETQDLSKVRVPFLKKKIDEISLTSNILLHNHFPENKCISDKKNLLENLTVYLSKKQLNIFDFIPESYQLTDLAHPIVSSFHEHPEEKVHWLIKPGENSNRGKGIVVTHNRKDTLQELKKKLDPSINENPSKKRVPCKNLVLQRYLVPLLYNNRKFDIRSYMLVTLLNKQLRVYCYDECYIRTSSKPFEIDSPSKLVHLTNDAIQAQSNQYGKYQEGNKVSQTMFAKYIDEEYKKKGNNGSIWKQLKTEMQKRCIDVIESSYQTLVTGCSKTFFENNTVDEKIYYFQLFGMDFMIDDQFKLWLIEVNTNPAITHDCSKVLNLLIPKMLDNMLSLAVEPLLRPLRIPETPFSNHFTAVLTKQLK